MHSKKIRRQIIALGGGGFSENLKNLALEKFILHQARPSLLPRVCFLPTAAADDKNYIDRFYRAFHRLNCETLHMELVKKNPRRLEQILQGCDVIFVGGGDTAFMLKIFTKRGMIPLLKGAWHSGVVMAGVSAGSICWFEQGITDSIGDQLSVMSGFGFLKGSNCVHYDSEPLRRPAFHKFLREKKIKNGFAADDGVALHFIGTRLHQVVSLNSQARAYRVKKVGQLGVVEEALNSCNLSSM